LRVLVTGAAGFVGSHLVRHLLACGDEVVATKQEGQSVVPPEGGLAACYEVDLVDPRQSAVLGEILCRHDCDTVVHLAALSDVAASWKEIAECYRVNVQGTETVLRAARDRARVVFASSAEVYGKVAAECLPITEELSVAPSTPYAMSKACAERLALFYGARVVRSFNLVGEGQSPRFAISSFAHQLHRIRRRDEEPVLRVGNLDSQRDFLHVADGAAGYRAVALSGADSTVYNLASGHARCVRDVLNQLIEITGLDVRIETDPERLRPSDVPVMEGNPGRLEALGWRSKHSLEDALRDLWESLECLPRHSL
jgi:GDP-4-dehydro-6-deoxy-D-mannose reductase